MIFRATAVVLVKCAPFPRHTCVSGPTLPAALWHFTMRFMKRAETDPPLLIVIIWSLISPRSRGQSHSPPTPHLPANVCADLRANESICQDGWLMRGKLSVMMLGLDRKETVFVVITLALFQGQSAPQSCCQGVVISLWGCGPRDACFHLYMFKH